MVSETKKSREGKKEGEKRIPLIDHLVGMSGVNYSKKYGEMLKWFKKFHEENMVVNAFKGVE